MTNCSTIRRLGRPRKADSEKRVALVVSLSPSIISQLEEVAARKFNYNRSIAAESLIACGLEAQKGEQK